MFSLQPLRSNFLITLELWCNVGLISSLKRKNWHSGFNIVAFRVEFFLGLRQHLWSLFLSIYFIQNKGLYFSAIFADSLAAFRSEFCPPFACLYTPFLGEITGFVYEDGNHHCQLCDGGHWKRLGLAEPSLSGSSGAKLKNSSTDGCRCLCV